MERAIITVKDTDRETLIAKYEMMSNVFTVLEINLIKGVISVSCKIN